MGRRRFDQAFKLEAVTLVRERGVSAAQAARDLARRLIDLGDGAINLAWAYALALLWHISACARAMLDSQISFSVIHQFFSDS